MVYERKQAQISAFIAEETKLALDRYVEATGMKKNRVIEDALKHHLAALDEIPAKYIIDPDVVVSVDTWAMMWEMIETEREPSPSLRQMWKDHYEFERTNGKSLEDRLPLHLLAAEGDSDAEPNSEPHPVDGCVVDDDGD